MLPVEVPYNVLTVQSHYNNIINLQLPQPLLDAIFEPLEALKAETDTDDAPISNQPIRRLQDSNLAALDSGEAMTKEDFVKERLGINP